MDGDIRIGVGKCLRIFAFFGLLFGAPATAMLVTLDLKPPMSVFWVVLWFVAQAAVGTMIHSSGLRARRLQRQMELNATIERAMRVG